MSAEKSGAPLTALDRLRIKLRPLLLPTFCLAQLLDALNLSGANVALPEIAADLGFTTNNLQWVISAYALTFGGFLLLTGRMGDIYGHRNFFVAGLAWFTVFAVLSGFAQSTTWMIVARGFQGIGAASTIPNAIALILQCYPIGRTRNQAMSVFASTGAVGFVIGLILGGAVTSSSLGWRWIFFLSAIISGSMVVISIMVIPSRATLAAAAAASAEPNSEKALPAPVASNPIKQRVDYLGAALSTASMLLLVFVLTDANSRGWGSALIISLLIVSLLLIGLFVFWETKASQPLMPMSIWRLPNFAPAFVIAGCLVGFFQAYLYFITLTFNEVMSYSAIESAVRYLPLGIVASIMGIMTERIIVRFNIKLALVAGLALGTVGNIIIGFWDDTKDHSTQYWSIVFPSFIIGCTGLSSVYASVSIAAISAAPAAQAGIVGGLLNTAFQLGGGVGLAIATAVATAVNSPDARGHDLMKGFHAGLWTATGMVGLGLVVAILFVRAPSHPPAQDTPDQQIEEILVGAGGGAELGAEEQESMKKAEMEEIARSSATLAEVEPVVPASVVARAEGPPPPKPARVDSQI
ncbi:hypothetical protein HDU87_008398 [Geranomyces variabilis]|uniref:Major facilitator superfamily (MFS) profile domain-containing protein n=1 Tax=Geranomyces variabilis TaxID=109894 RepID=A0AAD5TE09_9FUNG|nr:hypothetical protein HDU87_008398 [Geranomyces variabilis]